jgi:O-antigen/teichoic acid export membrane protein
MNILSILRFLKLKPFNTSSEQGRSDERQRRIALSVLTSALSRLVSVSAGFITIPLTLHYLGPERFGLWMTINSIIAMLSFADFGIGNGLLNSISEANGKNDNNAICKYISSAYVVLGSITLFILLAFNLIYPFVSWADLINVKSTLAIEEVGLTVAVLVSVFSINITAGIIQRVQMGLQMSFASNLWQISAGLLALLVIIIFIHLNLGLPWLVFGIAGVPLLLSTANSFHFFLFVRRDLSPKIKYVNIVAIKKIAHTGLLFLILQITASLVFSSDSIIISKILGAEAVTQYSVPEKIFSIIPIFLSMVLTPLWPAYGEAIGRGDGAWVRRVFIKSLWLSFVFSSISAVFILIGANFILSIWVGKDVNPPFMLLLGLGVWKVCEACGNAFAMLLNGANVIKIQVVLALIHIVLSISIKINFVKFFGIYGSVWGTIVAYVFAVLLPLFFLYPKLIKKMT